VGSPTLVQVAEASWSEPAVGIRGGVGYEPVAVTPGNLRAVGFADLRAGSAFLEERWLTDEMAAGRTKLSGIHTAAAEVLRVVFVDGARQEVERAPEQLPSSDPSVPRAMSDPLWMLDVLRNAGATEASARALSDADLVATLPPAGPGRRSILRARKREPRQLLVWTDEAGRAARIALGEAFNGAHGPFWWIAEFGPYGALARVMELHEGLPARTSA
jgi:hypothetical protein